MSLVRVSEGDGWVSELPCAPNKSLTPITLGFLTSAGFRSGPKPRDVVRLIQVSVSLVRVSEDDGWVSDLPHDSNKCISHTNELWISALPSIKSGNEQAKIWPKT